MHDGKNAGCCACLKQYVEIANHPHGRMASCRDEAMACSRSCVIVRFSRNIVARWLDGKRIRIQDDGLVRNIVAKCIVVSMLRCLDVTMSRCLDVTMSCWALPGRLAVSSPDYGPPDARPTGHAGEGRPVRHSFRHVVSQHCCKTTGLPNNKWAGHHAVWNHCCKMRGGLDIETSR